MSIWKLMAGQWGPKAGDYDFIHIDAISNALPVIESEHLKVHEERSFQAHFDNITTNNDDHRTAIGFTVPDTTTWIHLVLKVMASQPAEVFFEENPTIDNDKGTEQTIYNRNRNSGNTSIVKPLTTAGTAGSITTFTEAQIVGANYTPGTILTHHLLAGGEGPMAVGGEGRGAQEWILDQGGKYLIRMQNIGANTNQHCLDLNWYELVNKH